MNYHLRIYDNYHHGDESEAYDHGSYSSHQEAERAAKAIVNEFLEHNWQRGMKPGILLAHYALYGEDPVILPADHGEGEGFSAREYAVKIAGSICKRLEDKHGKEEVQSVYQKAIKFAADKHGKKGQKVKGTELPYVVHLSNVAMEIFMAVQHTRNFDLVFAIQIALLHDTIEDTDTRADELGVEFGEEIAIAVKALSKDKTLPKQDQMVDSVNRIKKLPKEVWAVKLADRITNLQPAPGDWTKEKRKQYLEEARFILDELREGNEYLAKRLEAKIEEYRNQNKEYLLDNF